MSEQAKIERAVKILLALNSKYGKSIYELAKYVGISTRSIYRYLDTFKNIGFIVDYKIGEDGNRYYYIENNNNEYKSISELLYFSEEESYILSKAIQSIENENLIKQNLAKKLYSLYNFKRVAVPIIKKENSEIIHNLTTAISNKKQVVLKNYKSSHSGEIRNRLIEPFGFTSNFISIWSYDIEAQQNKIFKTARIQEVIISDNYWQNEAKHKKGFIDAFRITSYKKISVKLQLTLRACNLLIEEYPLSEKNITKIDDNTYIYDSEVANLAGIGRFTLGLIDEIEIIKPQALKNYIIDKIKNLTTL
ncbi:MAG: WYL domain-containing protein [Bacteroidetes bacterium]|nr:WYL domain-containing protein [Bacteroidota bacterium]